MVDHGFARGRATGFILATVLVLCGAFLATACGGEDDGNGEDNSAQPSATQPTPEEPTNEPADDAAPTSPAPPETEIDACGLVTKAEIEAAIGSSVLDGKADQAANLFTCSFNDPEYTNIQIAGVAVFVADNEDDANEVYETAKSNAAEVQEVDGVGEAAYWDAILNSMQIHAGRYEVSVDVAADDGLDQLAAAKAIAAQALSRLP